MKGLRFVAVGLALMFVFFSNVGFAGIGVTDESLNQQNVSAVKGVLQAFIDAENANYAPEKVASAFDLLTTAVQNGEVSSQAAVDVVTSIFSGLDLRTTISSIISTLASKNMSSLKSVLQAFVDAENANYAPEKVASAFDLLTKAVQNGEISSQAAVDVVTSIFSGLDLRTTISSIISALTSSVSGKDVQYSYTEDIIAAPIGAMIVPLIGIVDAILIPILPGGSMPAAFTRIVMMDFGFPMIDFILNSFPILRPLMMDFVAPIMSHMH